MLKIIFHIALVFLNTIIYWLSSVSTGYSNSYINKYSVLEHLDADRKNPHDNIGWF